MLEPNIFRNYKILLNFDFNSLIFDPNLFPGKNSPNIAKKIVLFLERCEEIEPWFWYIWITQWLRFFPTTAYLFRFRPSSGGTGWTKSANFGSASFSWKLESFNFFFKQCFCLIGYYLCWELRQYRTILRGVRGQKPRKKGHFVDVESVRKTLKTFNLTTTNAILMKLTTIVYLHKSVNRKLLEPKIQFFGVMSVMYGVMKF